MTPLKRWKFMDMQGTNFNTEFISVSDLEKMVKEAEETGIKHNSDCEDEWSQAEAFTIIRSKILGIGKREGGEEV